MKEQNLRPRARKKLNNILHDISENNLELNLHEIIEDDLVEFDEDGMPKELLFED